MSKVEEYADGIERVLPCTTREEITRKLRSNFPRITIALVDGALHWIRKNPELAGFNVGYVKKGIPGIGDTGRYFVVNKGDPSFKFTGDHREHFDNGLASNILSIQTLAANMEEMMETAKVHEVLRIHRRALEEMADMVGYCARQTRRIYNVMAEKRSA